MLGHSTPWREQMRLDSCMPLRTTPLWPWISLSVVLLYPKPPRFIGAVYTPRLCMTCSPFLRRRSPCCTRRQPFGDN